MKFLFYIGAIGIILFEILKVYYIMPFPGSQEMNSIDLAYFLYAWRWAFRGVFLLCILAGSRSAFKSTKWLSMVTAVVALAVFWLFNFKMTADHMFYQPDDVIMVDAHSNRIPGNKLIIGVNQGGASKAYPLQLIAYHHQVLDTLNGHPIMVTYCSVCRSGRVFKPEVNGKYESFRLVGMDHYNAMFEDNETKSWWRQESGEAAAGPLKGTYLPEVMSIQTTLDEWIALHPNTLIMQPDSHFMAKYESLKDYDFGVERGRLTMTDTVTGHIKSWIVGVKSGDSTAFIDWNDLKERRLVNFHLNNRPMVVALASDDQSFFAFERNNSEQFTLSGDTLVCDSLRYDLQGKALNGAPVPLKEVQAYQEFLHSWQTFHPGSRDIIRD